MHCTLLLSLHPILLTQVCVKGSFRFRNTVGSKAARPEYVILWA